MNVTPETTVAELQARFPKGFTVGPGEPDNPGCLCRILGVTSHFRYLAMSVRSGEWGQEGEVGYMAVSMDEEETPEAMTHCPADPPTEPEEQLTLTKTESVEYEIASQPADGMVTAAPPSDETEAVCPKCQSVNMLGADYKGSPWYGCNVCGHAWPVEG